MRTAVLTAAFAAVLTCLPAAPALAQEMTLDLSQPFDASTWVYGPRTSLPEGQEAEIWNPAKRTLMEGGDLIGGTIRGTDPRIYCAMANAGYGYTWVEKQHEATDWESVARMWRTCPTATAVPGVRIAYTDER